MARKRTNKSNRNRLPAVFSTFIEKYPGLAEAHEAAARFVDQVGPLDARTRALVKIGICLGAGLESALRSHVRRGRKAGLKPIEIEQAILLGMTTVGFPRTVAGWTWAHQALDDQP